MAYEVISVARGDGGGGPMIRRLRRLWWERNLRIGSIVEDCRYERHVVVRRDGDDVILDDGASCSVRHCLDPWPT